LLILYKVSHTKQQKLIFIMQIKKSSLSLEIKVLR